MNESRPVADTGRPVTAKIPGSDYDMLVVFANAFGTTPADEIRSGVDAYLARRMKDPDLGRMIQEAQARFLTTLSAADASVDAAAVPLPEVKPKPTIDADRRAVTLRMGAAEVNRLTAFALVDTEANTIAEQIRIAVAEWVAKRREDPNLESLIQRNHAATMAKLGRA